MTSYKNDCFAVFSKEKDDHEAEKMSENITKTCVFALTSYMGFLVAHRIPTWSNIESTFATRVIDPLQRQYYLVEFGW